MAVIRSSSQYPIALSSRTHTAAKLIAPGAQLAHTVQQQVEPAAKTSKRVRAQRDAQLGRALARNTKSIFTRA
jgi:hypothetical protein